MARTASSLAAVSTPSTISPSSVTGATTGRAPSTLRVLDNPGPPSVDPLLPPLALGGGGGGTAPWPLRVPTVLALLRRLGFRCGGGAGGETLGAGTDDAGPASSWSSPGVVGKGNDGEVPLAETGLDILGLFPWPAARLGGGGVGAAMFSLILLDRLR